MDGTRFDALTARMTASLSRRRGLGALTALGAGALLPRDDADAKKHKKKPCPPCKGRKHGKCKRTLPDGAACPGGTCQGGACTPSGCPAQRQCGPDCCPEGQVCGSNGICVDPTCCNGDATCGPHTTAGRLCCIAPRVARCCCDNPAGSGNGYAICCDPATDECPHSCTGGSATGGRSDPDPGPDGTCLSGSPGVAICVA